MDSVTIITPPDKLLNQSFNIFLIYPSIPIKADIQQLLTSTKKPCNVYLYELESYHDYDWLLTIFKICDLCVLDLDTIPQDIKRFESYFLSSAKTFYFTTGSPQGYDLISKNHIFSIDSIYTYLGDIIEISKKI